MRCLGNFATTDTVRFLWNTYATDGASVTRSGDGTIRVYKDNSAVQRASSSGITDTEDFDSLTGVHLCSINLSDDADPGFYAIGTYTVVLAGSTIGGASVNTQIAWFRITIAGGGEPPGGTNPPTGTQPSSAPLIFLEVKTGSTTTAYAETALNDSASWWSGQKKPKILSVSPISRKLSREGGFETTSWRVELDDRPDPLTGARQFRSGAASGTIGNSYCAIYVVDDTVRRAEGTPYRIAAGLIVNHRALPNWRYELLIEDVLGTRFADAFRQPVLPPNRLTSAAFGPLDPATEGRAGPICLGELSDEGSAQPQGVVPALYMGSLNLTAIHSLAINTIVDAYLLCEHAVADVVNLYYNDPTSIAGGNPLRYVVPDSAYGVAVWTPHKTGWTAGTGFSTDFIDYNGRRFTPIFIPFSLSQASAFRERRAIISANLLGAETNGDATGAYFSAPEPIVQHLLVNYVFTSYSAGSYAPVPFFPANSYTIFDTSTFDAATSVSVDRMAGGYKAGILYGNEGEQQDAIRAVRDILQGTDLDLGINRHGQIMASREPITPIPVVSFTARHDIIEGSFSMWSDHERYANQIEWMYGPRYLPPSAPLPTPSVGTSLPISPIKFYCESVSSLITYSNSTAINAFGRIQPYRFTNVVTQHNSTAANVASFTLQRLSGPSSDGPWRASFDTGWQGLGKGGSQVELGTIVQVEHPERVGVSATTPMLGRVVAITVKPLDHMVSLELQLLADLGFDFEALP